MIFKGLIEWLWGLFWEACEWAVSALLGVFSMDLSYFESALPASAAILSIMSGVGWALLLGNVVFQAAKSMMSGLGFEGDDPKVLAARTLIFGFLLTASRQICDIGLGISASVVTMLQVPSSVSLPKFDLNMFAFDASWLVVIIMGVILFFQMVKFFFQVGERYELSFLDHNTQQEVLQYFFSENRPKEKLTVKTAEAIRVAYQNGQPVTVESIPAILHKPKKKPGPVRYSYSLKELKKQYALPDGFDLTAFLHEKMQESFAKA
jgi:hypothetical protein